MTRPADKNFSTNCLAWSPDGSMIAAAAGREVFIVRVADGQLKQLTAFEWSRISNVVNGESPLTPVVDWNWVSGSGLCPVFQRYCGSS